MKYATIEQLQAELKSILKNTLDIDFNPLFIAGENLHDTRLDFHFERVSVKQMEAIQESKIFDFLLDSDPTISVAGVKLNVELEYNNFVPTEFNIIIYPTAFGVDVSTRVISESFNVCNKEISDSSTTENSLDFEEQEWENLPNEVKRKLARFLLLLE